MIMNINVEGNSNPEKSSYTELFGIRNVLHIYVDSDCAKPSICCLFLLALCNRQITAAAQNGRTEFK